MVLLLWQTTINGRLELHVRGRMSQVVASDDLSGLLEVSSVTSSRYGRFALGAASTSLTPQDNAPYHGGRIPTSSFQGRGTTGTFGQGNSLPMIDPAGPGQCRAAMA